MIRTIQDRFGRAIGDLRLSVTDRCNFRCSYCIPVENVTWTAKQSLMSIDEIVRLTEVFVRLGVKKVRLTGGEPLLRRDLVEIARRLSRIDGISDLALTTNGQLLERHAAALRAAGVHRVNVSLDSLDREKFRLVTRRDMLDEVLRGLDAAFAAGFDPIRVNAVIIRGVNDDEIGAFARFATETGYTVRFIEFMPLDSGHRWSRDQVVPASEIVSRLRQEADLKPMPRSHPSDTAMRFAVAGGGEIGIIAPVSTPFCGNCNRVRLTADGKLMTCLFSTREHDLLGALRAGATDHDLEMAIVEAVAGKEAGHRIGADDFERPGRTMSNIGG